MNKKAYTQGYLNKEAISIGKALKGFGKGVGSLGSKAKLKGSQLLGNVGDKVDSYVRGTNPQAKYRSPSSRPLKPRVRGNAEIKSTSDRLIKKLEDQIEPTWDSIPSTKIKGRWHLDTDSPQYKRYNTLEDRKHSMMLHRYNQGRDIDWWKDTLGRVRDFAAPSVAAGGVLADRMSAKKKKKGQPQGRGPTPLSPEDKAEIDKQKKDFGWSEIK